MTAIHIVFSSILTALRYPRVWLTVWFVVAMISAVNVLPFFNLVDAKLAHHPGAGIRVDQSLDSDLVRLNQTLVPDITLAMILSLFVMTFLGGGILASVGTSQRFSYSGFLANSAYFFTRNLRALILFLVPLFLVNWGIIALLAWLQQDYLRQANPGGPWILPQWINLEVGLAALGVLLAVAFYTVAFAYKVSRAILVVHDRHSALMAWSQSLGKILLSPIRTFLVVAGLIVVWQAVAIALGVMNSWLLETTEDLLLGAVMGQISMMWLSVVNVATFVAARRFLTVGEDTEDEFLAPAVLIPRREAVKTIQAMRKVTAKS